MLFYLNHYGLLKLSGTDAKKLLQGQVTCNMDEVSENEPRMGALCNVKGRVLSLFYVFYAAADYYLLTPKNLLDITLTTLKKYAVFYKLQISAVNHAYFLGVSDLNYSSDFKDILQKITVGRNRYLFVLNDFATATQSKNDDEWKKYNILDRLPNIYPETIGQFLPHEINLPQLGAVSFNKGCYTGQEIIARMHYRGKLKKHLYAASIESNIPVKPGDKIFSWQNQAQQECGTVVDACLQQKNEYDALIVIDEKNAQNQILSLEHYRHNDESRHTRDGVLSNIVLT